jgi:hypothetical protein
MTCHMHPGNNMVATYLGLLWWDNETDARAAGMYPSKQRSISAEEEYRKLDRNPEGSSVRGNWSDPAFLQKTGTDDFNSKLARTQFADFHGHGWMFRAVFKRDREGHMLDAQGERVNEVTPAKLKQAVSYRDDASDKTVPPPAGVPVHLKDIHLEKASSTTSRAPPSRSTASTVTAPSKSPRSSPPPAPRPASIWSSPPTDRA